MSNGYYQILNLHRRWGILIAIILFSSFVHAQKISVSRFVLDESDLTAQNKSTSVEDQNGDKCALIRVQTTQKGFSFDVGSVGVQKLMTIMMRKYGCMFPLEYAILALDILN